VILVCGSRGWTDVAKIESALKIYEPTVVIHGGAVGADQLAAQIAHDLGHDVRPPFLPNWHQYGARAGFVRNAQMLDEKPDLVVAFWDGESRGTKNTITGAMERGIIVRVVSP
jgi:uncharacterized phage-like protein YoqJ